MLSYSLHKTNNVHKISVFVFSDIFFASVHI